MTSEAYAASGGEIKRPVPVLFMSCPILGVMDYPGGVIIQVDEARGICKRGILGYITSCVKLPGRVTGFPIPVFFDFFWIGVAVAVGRLPDCSLNLSI